MTKNEAFLLAQLKEILATVKGATFDAEDLYGAGFLDGLVVGQLTVGGRGPVRALAKACADVVLAAAQHVGPH